VNLEIELMPDWETRPFQHSLDVLAQIALRAAGACGYAFFQKSRETGSLVRLAGGGPAIPEVDAHESPTLVKYPLPTEGALRASVAFAFSNEAEALQARPRLDRIATTIQAIWAAAAAEGYSDLAGRVAELETQLMDSKIADRAHGLMNAHASSDPAELIARHVDGVLRPTPTRRILEQALAALEEEIEERRLVAEAKQILQHLHQVSEEQAHTQLRLRSRKSRKRLKLVARQVIEEQRLLRTENA
jgi:hypothetical protein